jgi:acyl phosphate:glycerol-3-phosphate acyltransferase
MEMILAVLAGYLVGTLPTAVWLGKLRGIDLRRVGSGNPGANNALRTGGAGLAAPVLFVEMAKGVGAALAGSGLAGEAGMVAAGIAAAAGNLYNIWYRFSGGKGLGITGGVLIAAWPTVFVPAILVIALSAWATRSAGGASLIAVVFLAVAGLVWEPAGVPTGWGVEPGLVPFLGLGLGFLIFPRHLEGARFRRESATA